MVTSYSSTNVTLVATMMMVLVIYLSMCGTFDNVAATSTDSIFQRKRTWVTINNQLENNTPLQANCSSGHDHLGQHQINPKSNYSFTFRPDFLGTTTFRCDFSWGANTSYSFNIYEFDRDHKVCSACVWKILSNGTCEFNYRTKDYDLCYKWT